MCLCRSPGQGVSSVSVTLVPNNSESNLTKTQSYFTVLRLALPRTSIRDITYEGVVIPKGTVFFLNAWACNMGKLLPTHISPLTTSLTNP
jgi:hypothetical protein